ncbi:hypothetical protein EBZ39_19735 [bacterium]|nr:hypothetical protein [bacterium]
MACCCAVDCKNCCNLGCSESSQYYGTSCANLLPVGNLNISIPVTFSHPFGFARTINFALQHTFVYPLLVSQCPVVWGIGNTQLFTSGLISEVVTDYPNIDGPTTLDAALLVTFTSQVRIGYTNQLCTLDFSVLVSQLILTFSASHQRIGAYEGGIAQLGFGGILMQNLRQLSCATDAEGMSLTRTEFTVTSFLRNGYGNVNWSYSIAPSASLSLTLNSFSGLP